MFIGAEFIWLCDKKGVHCGVMNQLQHNFMLNTPARQVIIYGEALVDENYELLAQIIKCIKEEHLEDFLQDVDEWLSKRKQLQTC